MDFDKFENLPSFYISADNPDYNNPVASSLLAFLNYYKPDPDLAQYLIARYIEWFDVTHGSTWTELAADIAERDEQGRFVVGSHIYGGDVDLDDFVSEIRYNCKVKDYGNGLYKRYACEQDIFRCSAVQLRDVLPTLNSWIKDFWYEQRYNKIDDEYAPGCDEDPDERAARIKLEKDRRAIARVYEIVVMNKWDYFLTITFDDAKVDAHNVAEVMKKLANWLKNMADRKGLKYLLVPEYHPKSGRVHCHALINDALEVVDSGTRMVRGYDRPVKVETIKYLDPMKNRVLRTVYNVPEWKYGFSTAIPTYGQPPALASYVSKYITKDTAKIFGRRYWCSRNIQMYPAEMFTNIPLKEYDEMPSKEYRGVNERGPAVKIENHVTYEVKNREKRFIDQLHLFDEKIGQPDPFAL